MINRDNIEWRSIIGFENQYEISNYGDFHILPYQFIDKAGRHIFRKEKYIPFEKLKPYGGNNNNNYLGIHLGGMTKSYVHILVAKSFIPNPESKSQINHIDGNPHNNYCGCKKNNYLDSNLEWSTPKENMEHASKNGLINKDSEKRKKQCAINRKKVDYSKFLHPVVQLTLNGELVAKYNSIKEATEKIGVKSQNIHAVAIKDGYHKTTGGFNWIYAEEYDETKDYKITIDQTKSTRKAVAKCDISGNILEEYESISDACRKNGFTGGTYIGEVCGGRRKTYKGYIWKFI